MATTHVIIGGLLVAALGAWLVWSGDRSSRVSSYDHLPWLKIVVGVALLLVALVMGIMAAVAK